MYEFGGHPEELGEYFSLSPGLGGAELCSPRQQGGLAGAAGAGAQGTPHVERALFKAHRSLQEHAFLAKIKTHTSPQFKVTELGGPLGWGLNRRYLGEKGKQPNPNPEPASRGPSLPSPLGCKWEGDESRANNQPSLPACWRPGPSPQRQCPGRKMLRGRLLTDNTDLFCQRCLNAQGLSPLTISQLPSQEKGS